MRIFFSFIALFLVSSSHDTFAKEYCWFWGGAIIESVKGVYRLKVKLI